MQETAKTVIIGGGVIGLSVAYHLAKAGATDIILLERNQLTSGTSWHAAGIVGPLRATLNMTRLAIYATELFGDLENETGQATGYLQTGGMWLAQTEDRMEELRRIKAMGDYTGLSAHIITPEEVASRFPFTHIGDLAGGIWVEEDGQANPVDICMAYARGARKLGVNIREHCGMARINRDGRRITGATLEDGRIIHAGTVINCTGVWSHQVGNSIGMPAPVQAVEHMYIVTEPVENLTNPCPIVRDLDARIYLKGDAGKLVLGGFEPDAKPWDVNSVSKDSSYLIFRDDWEQFEPFMMAGLHRFPVLEQSGIQHFMNGPEGFTPDTKQVMGPVPGTDGYFVAAGFNSLGIVSSAGAGRMLADWVMAGHAPTDLWEVDMARFDAHASAPAFLRERMKEVVSNQFDMHWPLKQMKTGRNIRRSVLHRAFASKGAVFGAPTGWERPFWFAQDENEKEIQYSYGRQHWWDITRREAAQMAEHVSLLELSPFTKIDLQGADALSLLQRLCTSSMDVEPGRAVYTQMLNPRGGIEADVTVTRKGEDSFRIVSGAATRTKDLDHIRRAMRPGENVSIFDATSAEAVIAVMGPKSRDLLQSLSDSDFSSEAFPFGAAKTVDIGMAVVTAVRVSFVGELGWELYIPAEFAEYIHEALCEAGEAFNLGHAGHLCLDGCRMEKGFRHWSHDIGPDDSPLHAGLGFTIDWEKGDFTGRQALLDQKEAGIDRHLLLFEVGEGGEPPLILHDEVIYMNGRMAGLTTSGGYGPRTGRMLALGAVRCEPGTTKKQLMDNEFEIEVAGLRYVARPLARPPYDPDGSRMRG